MLVCGVRRVLTGEFVPWPIKRSSRISTMDRSSRGDQPDALCHRQKFNSRYLGAAGGVVELVFIRQYCTKLGQNLFMACISLWDVVALNLVCMHCWYRVVYFAWYGIGWVCGMVIYVGGQH